MQSSSQPIQRIGFQNTRKPINSRCSRFRLASCVQFLKNLRSVDRLPEVLIFGHALFEGDGSDDDLRGDGLAGALDRGSDAVVGDRNTDGDIGGMVRTEVACHCLDVLDLLGQTLLESRGESEGKVVDIDVDERVAEVVERILVSTVGCLGGGHDVPVCIECVVLALKTDAEECRVDLGIGDDGLKYFHRRIRVLGLGRDDEGCLGGLVEASTESLGSYNLIHQVHLGVLVCGCGVLYIVDVVGDIVDGGCSLAGIGLLTHAAVLGGDELLVQDAVHIQLAKVGQGVFHLLGLEAVDKDSILKIDTTPGAEGVVEELEVVHPLGEVEGNDSLADELCHLGAELFGGRGAGKLDAILLHQVLADEDGLALGIVVGNKVGLSIDLQVLEQVGIELGKSGTVLDVVSQVKNLLTGDHGRDLRHGLGYDEQVGDVAAVDQRGELVCVGCKRGDDGIDLGSRLRFDQGGNGTLKLGIGTQTVGVVSGSERKGRGLCNSTLLLSRSHDGTQTEQQGCNGKQQTLDVRHKIPPL